MARKRRKNRKRMVKSSTSKTISVDRYTDLEDCELYIVDRLTSIDCDLTKGVIKFLQPEDSEEFDCSINMSQVDSARKLLQMIFFLANNEAFTKKHIFDLIHVASLDSYSKERDKVLNDLYRGFRHVVLSRDNIMKNHYFWWIEKHADDLKKSFFDGKTPEEIEELSNEGLDPSDESKCGERYFSFVGRSWVSYLNRLPSHLMKNDSDMAMVFQAQGDPQEAESVEANIYFDNIYFDYSDEDFKSLKKESA